MSLPHSTPSPPPPLTNELVELTLCLSLHSAQRARLKSDPMLTARLNVLSRSIVPSVTKVAVRFLPSVSLEEAAALGDLVVVEAMGQLALSLRGYRPLTYSSPSPNFLTVAARFGHLAVIQWWFANKVTLNLFADTLDVLMEASLSGHVDILEWWHANGLSLEMYDAHKVWARASEGGHVAVLQFWRDRGLQLPRDDSDAMDLASLFGHVDVLQWWKESGMCLEYSHRAIAGAVRRQRYGVLEWWSDSGLALIAEEVCVTAAALEMVDLRALEWLDRNRMLQVKPTHMASLFSAGNSSCIEYCMARFRLVPKFLEPVGQLFVQVSGLGRPDLLQLAVDYGFMLPTDRACLDQCLEGAARVGSIETLQWWLNPRIAPEKVNFNRAVVSAAVAGHAHVLEWLSARFCYAGNQLVALDAMLKAATLGHLNVIKWFTVKHPDLKATLHTFLAAVENGHCEIVEWWVSPDSGHPVPESSEIHSNWAVLLAAARNGYLECIKLWFAKADIRRIPNHLVLQVLLAAAQGRQVQFVKWWMCINAVYDSSWIRRVAEKASEIGSVEILDWLLDSNLFDKTVVYFGPARALRAGHVHVLEWWQRTAAQNGLQVRYFASGPSLFDPSKLAAILRSCDWLLANDIRIQGKELPNELIQVGNPALLLHVLASGLFQLPVSYGIIDEASKHGHVCVLEFRRQCDRDAMLGMIHSRSTYSKQALKKASVGGFVQVLDWWKHASNLPLRLPWRSLQHLRSELPASGLASRVVDWWATSGLLPATDPPVEDDEAENGGEEGDEEEESGDEELVDNAAMAVDDSSSSDDDW